MTEWMFWGKKRNNNKQLNLRVFSWDKKLKEFDQVQEVLVIESNKIFNTFQDVPKQLIDLMSALRTTLQHTKPTYFLSQHSREAYFSLQSKRRKIIKKCGVNFNKAAPSLEGIKTSVVYWYWLKITRQWFSTVGDVVDGELQAKFYRKASCMVILPLWSSATYFLSFSKNVPIVLLSTGNPVTCTTPNACVWG